MKLFLAALVVGASLGVTPALSVTPAKPLFAADDPVRVTITGPIGAIARAAEDSTAPRDATLAIAGTTEAYPIRLSARGISRRTRHTCQFPPLRVDFARPPVPTSLFAGQGRLKLVTHCQSNADFQQYLLLEYSAYRIFNLIDPTGFRVRLANVEYVEASGRPNTQRLGFFIEDKDDVARRMGLHPARVGTRISPSQLEPRFAARVALFQYMLGNLDWAMVAGPPGDECCHNSRLLTAAAGRPPFIPIAYDFDYSGLVDAPYAVPPEQFKISSVRSRVYRGYCSHNAHALTAAAEIRALRPQIEGLFGQIPQMSPRTRTKAVSYLARFFAEIATDDSVRAEFLKECLR